MVRILNHNFNNNYNMNRQEVVAKVVAAIFEILEGTISEISEKDSLLEKASAIYTLIISIVCGKIKS